MVGLHINPVKMDAMEKNQTFSVTKISAQLCKAHGLPVYIKLRIGGGELALLFIILTSKFRNPYLKEE